MADVRARALAVLERCDRLGDVWEMVVQHEHQHDETMLQTLQLAEPGVYAPVRRPLPGGGSDSPATVGVAGGPFPLGDPGVNFAYDNECSQHVVEVPSFAIDRTPVSNAAYLESSRTAATAGRSSGRRRVGPGVPPSGPSVPSTGPTTAGRGASSAWNGWTRGCRSCTSAGTRRTPTRAGAASGYPPRRSGRRPPPRTRRPGRSAACPGGRRPPTQPVPTSISSTSARPRAAPTAGAPPRAEHSA
jgi:hypothetical protein